MAHSLQRPLLVGGMLFVLVIGFLEILNHLLGEWLVYGLFAGAIATGIWWLQNRTDPIKATLPPARSVDATTVKRTLAEAERVLNQLAVEVQAPTESSLVSQPDLSGLQSQMTAIAAGLERTDLTLTILGSRGSGKTTLVQYLQANWTGSASFQVQIQEAPSFAAESSTGLEADQQALQQALLADLVVVLVTGDLTASELQLIQQLAGYKRLLLVLGKQDQYLPADRQLILNQMQQRTQGLLAAEDVVAIATAPRPIKVRQHQPDGSVAEWLETPQPEIGPLTERLDQILQQEGPQLVLASTFHHALSLKTQAQTVLNDVRRVRAVPVVEKYQWVAAATAFASPLPSLDVLATAVINAQMILDLGAIYQQKWSFQQAQKMATSLGSLMLKLGLVEVSSQAIGTLLKSNALTFVAGGCLQGISAAYLTRIAGLSLIEYFQGQEPHLTPTEAPPLAIERFSQVLQHVFQQNQQVTLLQSFVGQAVNRLLPALSSQPQLAVAPPSATATSPLLLPIPDVVGPVPPLPATPPGAMPLNLPLNLPDLTTAPLSVTPTPELQILDENGFGMRAMAPDLDGTSAPSN